MATKPKRAPKRNLRNGSSESSSPDPFGKPVSIPSGTRDDGATLLFEGAGPDTRVRLFREDDDKRWSYHGAFALEEATEEHVAELFGGGKYRAQLLKRNEQGTEIITKAIMFRVPGPYRPPTDRLPSTTKVIQPNNQGQDPAPAGPRFVTHQPGNGVNVSPREALDAVQVKTLMELLQATPKGGTDWKEILTLLSPVLVAVVERLLAPKDDGRLARIEERLLAPPPAGPVQSQISDVMKAIDAMLGVRDRIRESAEPAEATEGGPGSMLGVMQEVLRLIGARANGAPPPSAERVPGRVEVPMRPAEVPPVPPGPQLPMWQQMLRHYGAQLTDCARRGVDPGFLAENVQVFGPRDLEGVVREFVQKPDAAAIALQEIPALTEFEKWNAEFWTALKAGVLGEESAEG